MTLYTGGDKYKRIKYLPNTGHNMKDSDYLDTLQTYYYAHVYNIELPVYTFKHKERSDGIDLELVILNDMKPTRVKLWQATAPNRDFRISTTGKIWTSSEVEAVSDGVFKVAMNNPRAGFTAFMMEMEFKLVNREDLPLIRFTTSTYITPTTLPCKYHP